MSFEPTTPSYVDFGLQWPSSYAALAEQAGRRSLPASLATKKPRHSIYPNPFGKELDVENRQMLRCRCFHL
jgi:hypothetical protein